MIVWTIGYEKQRIDRFLATLASAGIRRIVDVRAVAWSHNKQYAKQAIAASLDKAGMAYTHLQALGNPKPGREAAAAGDKAEFHRVFKEHLAGAEPQAALAQLIDMAGQERVCLMCLEADPADCHRSLIGEALTEKGIEVRHLAEPDLFSRIKTR
jgi:uncharacterized protein (DUF488 family)